MKTDKKDPIQNIIEKSGINLQVDVAQTLKENGWEVLISPFYRDHQTNQSRETDVIAEKRFLVPTTGTVSIDLKVQLVIECKYIAKETVFWFDNKDQIAAEKLAINMTTLPPASANGAIKGNHFFEDRQVAKLFASGKNEEQKYETETFFKALNQVLHGSIYNRERTLRLLTEARGTQKTLRYPVIVCKNFDKLYQIKIGETSYEKVLEPSFEFEINYSYLNSAGIQLDEYFLVDIVNGDKLIDYLDLLNKKDVSAMQNYYR